MVLHPAILSLQDRKQNCLLMEELFPPTLLDNFLQMPKLPKSYLSVEFQKCLLLNHLKVFGGVWHWANLMGAINPGGLQMMLGWATCCLLPVMWNVLNPGHVNVEPRHFASLVYMLTSEERISRLNAPILSQ